MASTINASTSPAAIIQTADGTAILALQTGNTTAVTIDASQNVGIGTTSPTKKLQVVTNTASDGILISGSTNPRLQVIDTTNSVTLEMISGDSQSTIRTDTNHPLVFGTNGTERMTLDSSGNLLFNASSTDPYASGAGYGIAINGSGNYIAVARSSGASLYLGRQTSNGDLTEWWRGGTKVGSISVTTTATTYNTSSDYRLKENIVPMTGALDKVALLKPVTYKWIADGSNGQGFIAHELQEVVPDCVSGEKDAVNEDGSIKAQGVDTSFLVATLTAAIQEQQALITSLTARITALEGA